MPIVITSKYKLSAAAKKALLKFLKGEAGVNDTAAKLNTTRQRVYTMATAIFRHAATTGKLDIEAVIKDY